MWKITFDKVLDGQTFYEPNSSTEYIWKCEKIKSTYQCDYNAIMTGTGTLFKMKNDAIVFVKKIKKYKKEKYCDDCGGVV